ADVERAGGVQGLDRVGVGPAVEGARRGEGSDTLGTLGQLHCAGGASPPISVAAATAPAVTTAPTAAAGVAFANTVTGVTSAAQTVTVTNSGNAPLSVSGLSVTGVNAADFKVSSTTCLAGAIAAGGTCTVNLTFTPGATG